jgi:ABC-type Fe3+ transport system permease subunit
LWDYETHVIVLYSRIFKKTLSLLVPPLGTTTNAPSVGQGSTDGIPSVETTGEPSALGGDKESDSSNTLIYAIVGVLLLAIIGVVAYVIIRKRNQNNQAKHISPTTSMASSAVLNADMFENV